MPMIGQERDAQRASFLYMVESSHETVDSSRPTVRSPVRSPPEPTNAGVIASRAPANGASPEPVRKRCSEYRGAGS